MQMDDEFLEINDLDWFASYQDGALSHFATGGNGFVPDSVRASILSYELLFDYFCSLPEVFECEVEEENLNLFESHVKRERYLQSFISMAKKGLYSYDVESDGYKLIAKPRVGLRVFDLPDEVRSALGTVLASSSEDVRIIKRFMFGK
ncbi:hypothetical protein SAMN04490182_2018 [Pseudomonas cedrina]|uniref:Uncharacterized protein n=2 Tax=Pseudomonas cedrina TaxID=651740 RepID=A0A1V2K1F9_PSECE|nr:hypothetical protein [Pseudomonas cedrina]ONH50926.1 hypothetical protein BLL36_23740 [Pseudomonas cedrina subsp. cedrina]SDS63868.1 hypothetical protein SAMN04490182_2018 [Pseudomonas cedrina]